MSYIGNQKQDQSSDCYVEKQTVTASTQSVFTLKRAYTPGTNSLRVYVNGIRYTLDEYTETDVNKVTLDVAANTGDDVVFEITNLIPQFTTLAGNVPYTAPDGTATNIGAAVDTLYTGVPYSFRNKIINGNFDFWQRGTSTSASGYLADRWVCLHNGTTEVASQQAFAIGQTSVPGNPIYYMRHIVTSVAGANNYCQLAQRIESVRTLANKTATVSFWAKADTNRNIAIEFSQIFGSGGSPSTNITGIGVNTFAVTSSWQKFTTTVSIPSILGKTLGNNGDDYVYLFFWFDAGSTFNARTNSLGQQSGTFDIAQVQLEEGNIATPFEQRPKQVELALCQRYYEKSYPLTVAPGTASNSTNIEAGIAISTGTYWKEVRFKIPKRVSPTVSFYSYNGAVGNVWDQGSSSNKVASQNNLGTNGVLCAVSGFSANSGGIFHWTADAEL